jgi:hypothetical protein
VVNVLAIDTRGIFRFAVVNCLGTTHDAMVAMSGGMLDKLKLLPQYHLVGDSAFAHTQGMMRMTDINVRRYIYGDQLRSFRQISEWGMRIFQLPRLHVTLPLNNNTLRQAILMCSVLINNFKVNNGQKNQVTVTFD